MSRATLILSGRENRERAAAWCRNAPAGTSVTLKKPSRTLDQNALLWSRLTEIAVQVDWYGQKLTADDWKDVFTAALRQARVVPGLTAGTFVVLGMRTSDMTKEEMSNLLDLMDAFAAERGVVFKDTQEQAA